ncbi:MAG: hypothetical protein R2855_13480 [Thermomicrobiales bacterium]
MSASVCGPICCGVTFALALTSGVLLAALIFEVCNGVRSQSFPALVLLLGAGLTGVFLTADAFNFYVFFEIAMISSPCPYRLRRRGTPAPSGHDLRNCESARLGLFPDGHCRALSPNGPA